MKLKIISDGTKNGTRVIDTDQKDEPRLGFIQSIKWETVPNSYATYTTIKSINIPVEIETIANIEIYDTDNNIIKTETKPIHISYENYKCIITDEDGKQIGIVQEIEWNVDVYGGNLPKAKIKRIEI